MVQAVSTDNQSAQPPSFALEGIAPLALDRKRTPFGAEARRFASRVLLVAPFLMALSLSLSVSFGLVYFRESIIGLGEWGYVGNFLVQAASSATVFIPTLGSAYTFGAAVSLNPLLLGLVGGLGAAMGEMTGYYLGAKGRNVIQDGRLYQRLHAVPQRWAGAAIFAFALLPFPFDVAGLWAGTVRYPLARFFLYVAVGKVLNMTAMALVGYYGIPWLLQSAA